MAAISNWNLTSESQPPENRYVLVWDARRGLAMIAKRVKSKWYSTGNNIRWEDGTHWAEVVGPTGKHSSDPIFAKKTRKESQDN